MRRAILIGLLAIAAACESTGGTVTAGPAATPRPPNLVLVSFDTTRPDALGAYGSTGGHTPTIDALAREGTVFENVVAPMGATFPSHASMLTGLNPRQHGVRANHDRLPGSVSTLTERLADAGYDTAAFVSFGSMLSRGGLHQGFAVSSDEATGRSTGGIRDGEEVTRMAVEWLARNRAAPFFLFLHYFEAHAPYRRTPYADQQLADYDGPLAGGADVKLFYSLGKKTPWTSENRRAMRVLYDGEVRELDRLVAPVLTALEERGLVNDTIVVLTADHGQALGENGVVGHGLSLQETVLRVPLIVRDPRATRAPERVLGRVGLVDLTPTLLELAGLPPMDAVDGRSLAGALRGEPLSDRLYYAEMNEPLWDKDPTEIRRRDVAVYEGDLKAVHHRKGTRSYDLGDDPLAARPLSDEARSGRVAELEALAAGYHAKSADHSGRVRDPAVADELRALGYLE